MRVTEGLQRWSSAPARRPVLTIAIVLALALAGGVLALRLKPSAATDTFVSASSPAYRATVQDERHFGSDAIVVLVRAPLTELLAPARLATLTRLEACLAGQYVAKSATLHAYVPAAAGDHAAYGGPGSPCGELMRHRSALVVYGPGTFLNRAVAAVNGGLRSSLTALRGAGTRAATAAYRLALANGLSHRTAHADAATAREEEELSEIQQLERTATGSGLDELPSVTSTAFIRRVVFGSGQRARTPRASLRYLFPNADSALIQVRLRASLSSAAQAQAIGWIRAAVRMARFAPPAGGSDIVSGVPVVVSDLAGQITGAIGTLLVVALLAMAATLLIVFRRQPRLLPLAVALAASGITFGLLSLAGVSLTLASVAVLPILIGLAVDYGVQLQSRAGEGGAGAAAAVPTIATAALATGVGFLVLQLSPVPMVRGFGLVLVVGIAVALGCTLTLVPAVLALRAGDGGVLGASLRGAREILAPALRRPARIAAPALRGARELAGCSRRGAHDLAGSSLRGAAEILRLPRPLALREWILAGLARRPLRVLAAGLVLAAAGWVADGHTAVQSDITKLVPQSSPAMRNLRTLEATTGVSGEIDVAVRARNVATPAIVRWMSEYESTLLQRFGGGGSSCARATLCPALSLPDLFTTTGARAGSLTRTQINGLLKAVPAYFSSAVLAPGHREATLAFGIRLMPLARQQRVIDEMRSALHPPPGVRAALTGLPVLAAQADTSLSSSSRRLLTLLAGVVAVALALLLALRRPSRALIPIIPIVLATGWSSLVLYLLAIPLNPMSATLGTLVIAISTEFSVLLSERVRQERAAGHPPAVALQRAYGSTGRAVLVSGITAIAGFAVLAVSDIAMLRDFGLATLVDLTVSLAGVLLVLPAALALDPSRGRQPRADRPRLRRRASVA
jgi:hydrophobe/amphiphile efflux-3 (HAE3) family protein